MSRSATRTAMPLPPLPAVMGWWGMQELVEPRVRSLVAAHLGFPPNDSTSRAPDPHDRAIAVPDMLAFARTLEDEFAIRLPSRVLADGCSYDALVDIVVARILERRAIERATGGRPVGVRTTLRPAAGASGTTLVHSGPLTAYLTETVTALARRAPAGSRLDVTMDARATEADIATLRASFAPLAARRIVVRVDRA